MENAKGKKDGKEEEGSGKPDKNQESFVGKLMMYYFLNSRFAATAPKNETYYMEDLLDHVESMGKSNDTPK
eukprot:5390962-Ditylum_brightwellii.AAC.1